MYVSGILAKHPKKFKGWCLALGGVIVAFILGSSLMLPIWDRRTGLDVIRSSISNFLYTGEDFVIPEPFVYVFVPSPSNSFGSGGYWDQSVNWSWIEDYTTYFLTRDGVDVTNTLVVNFSTVFTARKYSYSFTAGQRGYFEFTLVFNSHSNSSWIDDVNHTVFFNYSDGQLFYNYSDIWGIVGQFDSSFTLVDDVFTMVLGRSCNKNVVVELDPFMGSMEDDLSEPYMTTAGSGVGRVLGWYFTPVEDGVLNSISIKTGAVSGSGLTQCAVYEYVDNDTDYCGDLFCWTEQKTISSTDDQTVITYNINGTYYINGGTPYYLLFIPRFCADELDILKSTSGYSIYKNDNYPYSNITDDPLTDEDLAANNETIYIYASYTPSYSYPGCSGDGYVSVDEMADTWSNVRETSEGTNVDTGATEDDGILAANARDEAYSIRRSFLCFNTSGIDDADTITDVYLHVCPFHTNDSSVIVVAGDWGDELLVDDFSCVNIGSPTNYSDEVTVWDDGVYTNITLNSDGISNVNKTGMTRLAIINYPYDYVGAEPGTDATYYNGLYFSDHPGLFPYLEVITEETEPIIPVVDIVFAGNSTMKGKPYYIPPYNDSTKAVAATGYFVNGSLIPDDSITIKANVTSSGTISSVKVHLLNMTTGTWKNTTSMTKVSGNLYSVNITGFTSGHKYGFDVYALDSTGGSINKSWYKNQTRSPGVMVRRCVYMNCVPNNVAFNYTPFYATNITISEYPKCDEDNPPTTKCSSQYEALDAWHQDQRLLSHSDSGILLRDLPGSETSYTYCGAYITLPVAYRNGVNMTCINSTQVVNVYYRSWWSNNTFSGNNTYNVMGFNVTNDASGMTNNLNNTFYSVNKRAILNISSLTGSNWIPDYIKYIQLATGKINVTSGFLSNFNLDSNKVYNLFYYQSGNGGTFSFCNRSYMSYVLFNLPSNTTLQGMDSDGDSLSDYQELFQNYTSPFHSDTDGDGVDDDVELGDGDDPNIYNQYSFYEPWIHDPNPTNGSTGIVFSPLCNVTVTHNNSYNVTWQSNYSNGVDWVSYQVNNSVASDTSVSWDFSGAVGLNTVYWWRVWADDGSYNVSETYHFTTKVSTWQQVSLYNGTVYDVSSWYDTSMNGSIFNDSIWYTSVINGSIYNVSNINIIFDYNGSIYDSSSWFDIIINGTIYNSNIWYDTSMNGSIWNGSSWYGVVDINGSVFNSSSWFDVLVWNGTLFNVSSWNIYLDVNGSIWNLTVANIFYDWNGTLYNLTDYIVMLDFNGSVYNMSVFKVLNDYNGSIYNVSSWNDLFDYNGTVFNASVWSWHIISDFNGSVFNVSSWYNLFDYNGSIYNVSSWNTVFDDNGTIFNISHWNNLFDFNGTLYNVSTVGIIDNYDGIVYNSSSYNIIFDINGTVYHVGIWHDILFNGSIFNGSGFNVLYDFNGSVYNGSSWYTTVINGSVFNVSTIYIISDYNGTIYNSSSYNIIFDINGTVYHVGIWHDILFNGSIFNGSGFNVLYDFNGTVFNSSVSFIIISGVFPGNHSVGVPLQPYIYATINHSSGSIMNVSWYWGTSNISISNLIETDHNFSNSTQTALLFQASNYSRVYYFRIFVSDGVNVANESFSFTTQGKTIGMPSMPGNGMVLGLVGLFGVIGFIFAFGRRRRRRLR